MDPSWFIGKRAIFEAHEFWWSTTKDLLKPSNLEIIVRTTLTEKELLGKVGKYLTLLYHRPEPTTSSTPLESKPSMLATTLRDKLPRAWPLESLMTEPALCYSSILATTSSSPLLWCLRWASTLSSSRARRINLRAWSGFASKVSTYR